MTDLLDLRLLTEPEAAAQLGLRRGTLRQVRRRGEISWRKIGRGVRYAKADLAEFIAKSQVPCESGK